MVGITYQQALADYIEHDLGGMITAADYPIDGGGRITADPTVTYTVQPGDYLRKIAADLLGSERRWPEIFDLNKGKAQADGRTLSNPNFIRIGWTLEVPRN